MVVEGGGGVGALPGCELAVIFVSPLENIVDE